MKDKRKYDDIINLPHYVSKNHKQMSLSARSAQFAPFSALTGYDELVQETARLTKNKREIDEEEKQILDNKLKMIQEKIYEKPKITITYFIPDIKKEGGEYLTVTGILKRIDRYNQIIILENKMQIPIVDIIEINIV